MSNIKKFENFSTDINEKFTFDFEDWDETDLSGMGMELAIDDLIDETRALINKVIEKEAVGMGVDIKDAKIQAAKAIRMLWIEKINRDLKF